MHLKFDSHSAFDAGQDAHPEKVMQDLGITYQHATPQSIADQWWFWNCKNAPNPLPKYLTELDMQPAEAVGFGLSQDDADRLSSNS